MRLNLAAIARHLRHFHLDCFSYAPAEDPIAYAVIVFECQTSPPEKPDAISRFTGLPVNLHIRAQSRPDLLAYLPICRLTISFGIVNLKHNMNLGARQTVPVSIGENDIPSVVQIFVNILPLGIIDRLRAANLPEVGSSTNHDDIGSAGKADEILR